MNFQFLCTSNRLVVCHLVHEFKPVEEKEEGALVGRSLQSKKLEAVDVIFVGRERIKSCNLLWIRRFYTSCNFHLLLIICLAAT